MKQAHTLMIQGIEYDKLATILRTHLDIPRLKTLCYLI